MTAYLRGLPTALVLAALLPVLAVTSAWAIFAAWQEQNSITALRLAVLARIIDGLELALARDLGAVGALATSADLEGPDLRAFHGQAQGLMAAHPAWLTVTLVNREGWQVLSARQAWDRPPIRVIEPESYAEVLTAGRPVVGGISDPAPVTGVRGIPIRVPVVRAGEVRFVLSAIAKADWISRLLQGAGLPEGWGASVLDRRGRILGRSRTGVTHLGEPGNPAGVEAVRSGAAQGRYDAKIQGTVDVVVTYQISAMAGWSVHVATPRSLLEQLWGRASLQASIGTVGVLVLGGVLAWLLRRDLGPRLRAGELVESIGDAFYALDAKLRFAYANQHALKFWGRDADALIGRGLAEALPETAAGDAYAAHQAVVRDRQPQHLETFVPSLRRWIELSIYPATHGGLAVYLRDVTPVKVAEAERRDAMARLEATVNTVVDAIVRIDEFGMIESANPAVERLFGYSATELVGANVHVLMPSSYAEQHDAYLQRFRNKGERRIIGIGRTVEGRRKDGTTFPLDLAVGEAWLGQRRIFVGVMRDLTERLAAEAALRARTAELETVMATVPAAVWLAHDPAVRRVTGSRYAAELLRLDASEDQSLTAMHQATPDHYRIFKDGRELPAEELPLQRAARGETLDGLELRVVFDDGTFFDELVNARPVRDARGRVTGAVGAAIDITQRKAAEERVRYLALHDQLTDLPNRVLLRDRLDHALARGRRERTDVALVLLDLDSFKEVNDTLGHPAGDRLLSAVAGRLRSALRASDTLARLGGDEFAIVQEDVHQPENVLGLVGRIRAALAEPLSIDDRSLTTPASVGIAVFPWGGEDAATLMRHADLALYRAKAAGGAQYRLYEPAMAEEVGRRRQLEAELRLAIANGELVLYYQPQILLDSGRIGGVEALVRWQHPDRGLLLPAAFIPAAEASGLIAELGLWVLREACRQARVWADSGRSLAVAVNVSPAQLRRAEMAELVGATLRETGLDPGLLHLEITETLLVDGPGSIADQNLRQLAAFGVGLAIDDFGTGFSSLTYLKRLPVNMVKIDRSFVAGIGRDFEDAALVEAMVTLVGNLGKLVVAEGVETPVQLDFLRHLKCDVAQGFLLGRPQPADRMIWPADLPC